MPKVTIYTQAYNPGEYLVQCIESVLGQTYTDFEWILIDHGSTDDTPAIIDRYAEQDKRIVPIHIAVNGSVPDLFYDTVRQNGTGKYLTWLDSDDWWDLDYLEHLVPFAEENDLDLALTGAVQYFQGSGTSKVMRQMGEPVVMTLEDFARNFPMAGYFAGAMWANLRPLEKVLEWHNTPENIELRKKHLTWRSDTLMMLNYVDRCQRIGIDKFAPYHYRRYEGSLSGKYKKTYFRSNIYFYQRLEEFLGRHGVLDEQMKGFLNRRHFFEMLSSVGVLRNTAKSPDEKLRICAEIVTHPITVQALPYDCPDQQQWRGYLRDIAADALNSRQLSNLDTLREILCSLAPDCCDVITEAGAALFAQERDLLLILFQNNRQGLVKRFLELIEKEERPEQYDLGVMLRRVLPEHSPLQKVEDVQFFKSYPELTQLILGSGYLAALDQMTALLMEGPRLKEEESFLQLYLTLAALENQVSAFLFGKLRLAELYRTQRRLAECRAVLDELEEMGAGELPEVSALKEKCGREGPL